jgi:cell division protein ZapA
VAEKRKADPASSPCAPVRDGSQWPEPAASKNRNSAERTVKIEIFDQVYNVNAEQNEEYLKQIAAYVDAKMREVAQATRMVDSVKVAVLAALNIADELYTCRQRQERIEGPLKERIEKCVSLVEKALEHTN